MKFWGVFTFFVAFLPSASFGEAKQAEVTVQHSAGSSVNAEKAITISYTVKNAPATSSIGFYLVQDSKAPVRRPLAVRAQNIDGRKKGEFKWDGRSFGCAPRDVPEICKGSPAPGKYHIEAVLFFRPRATLMRLRGYDPGKFVTTKAKSKPFKVTTNTTKAK